MELCLDLGAVLEGHPDVVLAVNRDVIDHRQPVGIPELRQRYPVPKLLQVRFNLIYSGCVLGNQVGYFRVSCLGLTITTCRVLLCIHHSGSCGVFFCFSVLCHNRGCEGGSAAALPRFAALLPPPYPGASFGHSLFRAVRFAVALVCRCH